MALQDARKIAPCDRAFNGNSETLIEDNYHKTGTFPRASRSNETICTIRGPDYLRSKFVDDTPALEIIPTNSISYLNNTVDELYHNINSPLIQTRVLISLNARRWLSILMNNNAIMKPFVLGGNVV